MQGRLIVFEGIEGCGKTTQIQYLCNWLLQQDWSRYGWPPGQIPPVMMSREPGGTVLGQHLRQVMLESLLQEPLQDRAELLLFAADRAQHVEFFLKPQLAIGAIILCDRYTDSTVAYQGYGRGFSLSLIHQLNQIATGGLESDLTLWLDIDAEVGLARMQQRGEADRIEQADFTFHQRVQQGFTDQARTYPQRIVRVDANQSEARVAQHIQDILRQRLTEWYPAVRA